MITLEKMIRKALLLNWKLWVYIEPHNKLIPDLKVLILDVDNEELGSDNFTPSVVEEQGYIELLSIHDIQGILLNMNYNSETDINKVLKYITYYIKHDAYLTETKK